MKFVSESTKGKAPPEDHLLINHIVDQFKGYGMPLIETAVKKLVDQRHTVANKWP